MPEGHTIHRLARDHGRLLVGRVVRLDSPQGRFAQGAALLDGRTCLRLEPYGKHLWYHFEGDLALHVHLGLYGKWQGGAGAPPPERGQIRVRMRTAEHWLELRGATAVEIHTPEDRQAVLDRLGPDPLAPGDRGAEVFARLQRRKAPLGQLLMDQSVLAGVGNVYRAEVLYRAAVSPYLPGRDVDLATWRAMWDDTRTLMRAGVRANRIVTTRPEDRDRPTGRVRREDAHYVYRRAGLPCRRCGDDVATAVLAGRNLFWCPHEQRLTG